MKVTVNVDCTPEEARTFLGLPDVKPMQDAFLAEIENSLRGGLQSMSPESLMKAWVPTGMKGADQMQKLFWSQMQQMFSGMGGTNPLLTLNNKKPDAA